MESFLDIKFISSNTTLVMQVLEMDERLRVGSMDHSFEYKGYHVRSWDYPEINHFAIYLRGKLRDRDKDLNVFNSYSCLPKEVIFKSIESLRQYIVDKLGVDIYVHYEGDPDGELIVRFVEFRGRTQLFTLE